MFDRQGTSGAASGAGSAILPYYPARVADARGAPRSDMKDTYIEGLVSIATADKAPANPHTHTHTSPRPAPPASSPHLQPRLTPRDRALRLREDALVGRAPRRRPKRSGPDSVLRAPTARPRHGRA